MSHHKSITPVSEKTRAFFIGPFFLFYNSNYHAVSTLLHTTLSIFLIINFLT
nr:MAG TPA: hypothetical protein [Caudoviricetes sp.]